MCAIVITGAANAPAGPVSDGHATTSPTARTAAICARWNHRDIALF